MFSQKTALTGLLLAISGTFLFSVKPIIIKHAYSLALNAEQIITLRMLISLPIYIAVVIFQWNRKIERRPSVRRYLIPIVGLGVLGYFFASYVDILGLQYISAQLERVVLFCFPTIVVLLSYFLFGKSLPKNIWIVLTLSYMGILFIFGHDFSTLGSNVLLGTSLVFVGAFSFAFYVLFSKQIMEKVGSQMFTAIAMISATIAIICYYLTTEDSRDLIVSFDAFVVIFVLAIFATVIPSLLVAEAIQQIGPERMSIVGTSGPVMTSLLAVIFLNEAFTIYHFIGLLLILSAISIMIKSDQTVAS